MTPKISIRLTIFLILLLIGSIGGALTSLGIIVSPTTDVKGVENTSPPNVTLNESNLYKVKKVVDGDTIEVEKNGKVSKVRLIGINTPETVDPRRPVQCFGKEASQKSKELMENKNVYLKNDSKSDDYDKYGRMLRYVWLEDKTLINEKLIKEGYAYEYTYDVKYEYQQQFKNAQKYAEANKLGLWGDVCGGEK